LSEKPFALVPDPRYFFLASSHREALAHLLYGIEQGEGFIEVVGQIGTGKTTLCRTLLERVGNDVEVAFIFNPSGSEIELLAAISREFGLPTAARSRSELIDELNRFLLQQRASGRRAVLVIDEAQYLEPQVLEQIRLLSNLETEREKLIQIVLIGQPELDANLARPDMQQLRQRITVRWKLEPFNRAEVRDYLEHRLRVAGLDDPNLFTSGGVCAIYRASRGVPRLINALADRALLAGYSRGKRRIDARIVHTTAKELPRQEPTARRTAMGLPVGVAAVLIACGLFIGLAYVAWGPSADQDAATPLPTVASARVEIPEAPPRPPVPDQSLIADGLERRLRSLSPGGSAAKALNALTVMWGYEAAVKGEVDPNRFASVLSGFSSLRVFTTRRTTDQLRRVNLPAILELKPPDVGRRYVALLTLPADGPVKVALDSQSFDLSCTELERLWTGRTFYFWANFESLPALASGMNGSAVRWLQARLTDLGYLRQGDASGEFDGQTMGAIRSFQTKHKLEETGEVGPETLIALYQALHYGAPRLVPRSEGS
jgi:general secretion pathway protein A